MRITMLAAVVLGLALAGPAVAEIATKEKGGARVRCFTEAQTGSNLRKKVCMTDEEREARRKADREALEATRGRNGPRPGSGPSAER